MDRRELLKVLPAVAVIPLVKKNPYDPFPADEIYWYSKGKGYFFTRVLNDKEVAFVNARCIREGTTAFHKCSCGTGCHRQVSTR